jgi:hypothetical protein
MGEIPSDPHLSMMSVDLFWKLLSIVGASASILIAWIWARLNRHEVNVGSLSNKLDDIERMLLQQRADMHKEFVSKHELREIINSVVSPVDAKISRIEQQVDRLVENHMVEWHKKNAAVRRPNDG